MKILKSKPDIDAWQRTRHAENTTLVPTMGNLHAGHAALIKHATNLGDCTVVSIYVNPTQFGPNEDYARYPRTLEADLALCEALGVDAVFTPDDATMYPRGLDASQRFFIEPPETLVNRYCGAGRPRHFDGVCTVVMKLFTLLQPQKAVFGQKDAQQLAVLQAMVQEFGLPIELVPHPVVREADGLALSSRNQYLKGPEERATALALYETLREMLGRYQKNPDSAGVEASFQAVWPSLRERYPLGDSLHWEYVAAVDADTFAPLERLTPNARLLAAAKLGRLRLIDTLHVSELS